MLDFNIQADQFQILLLGLSQDEQDQISVSSETYTNPSFPFHIRLSSTRWLVSSDYSYSITPHHRISKTVCMHFSHLRTDVHQPKSLLYGNAIPMVQEFGSW